MVPLPGRCGCPLVIYGDLSSRIEGDSKGTATVGASSSDLGF
ncbi:hypothetical protein GQ55_5G408400 [Panicum hallii var. hallii]|uniref:Uncharacterized protein n=1 Tax=Panicum hallii var. hallii TaxID=1504633 RepID=A0A2T7DNR4_9POAL|nr:hypothetical protein GQ55_5G408400 [Panicum hallii var. hallii]